MFYRFENLPHRFWQLVTLVPTTGHIGSDNWSHWFYLKRKIPPKLFFRFLLLRRRHRCSRGRGRRRRIKNVKNGEFFISYFYLSIPHLAQNGKDNGALDQREDGGDMT